MLYRELIAKPTKELQTSMAKIYDLPNFTVRIYFIVCFWAVPKVHSQSGGGWFI